MAGAAIALVMGTLGAASASADPGTDPTTSQDAKQAWQDSSHQAEIAAEQLNGARVAQTRADQAATEAAAGLVTAKKSLATAAKHAADTTKVVAGYQTKLDAFANASFRGARLGEMSALLTAKTADDFLDQASAIDSVAADTHHMLSDALAARRSAAAADAAAVTAETGAEVAKTTADTALDAAAKATADAQSKKASLDAASARYKSLFDQLSEQERLAAEAAAAKAKAESEARAREAAAAAAAARVAAAPAAGQDSAGQDSAGQSDSDQSDSDAPPADSQPASSSSSNSESSSGSGATSTAPAAGSGGDQLGRIAAQAAMAKIGGGYCYACDGPSSFDCSGLTTWAWGQAGISIPRVSYEQANFPEVPLDQLEPGDLVTYYSPVSHVAIYVGNGMVVSAADEELGILYVPVEKAGPDATGHRVPRG